MAEAQAHPIFKLAVRDKTGAARDFEGPLDLILFLLRRNKLEIQDVSIAAILDQYLDWIRQRQNLDLEVASEFIMMASQLLIWKTRMLLAIQDEETQSEMDELLQSLEARRRGQEYAKVTAAAALLEPLEEFGRSIVTRPPEPLGHGRVLDYSHEPSDLLTALSFLSEHLERKQPPSRNAFREIARREPYPVAVKAAELLELLSRKADLPFEQLFLNSRNRSETVATFLAVLELCRKGDICLSDTNSSWRVRRTADGHLPPAQDGD